MDAEETFGQSADRQIRPRSDTAAAELKVRDMSNRSQPSEIPRSFEFNELDWRSRAIAANRT